MSHRKFLVVVFSNYESLRKKKIVLLPGANVPNSNSITFLSDQFMMRGDHDQISTTILNYFRYWQIASDIENYYKSLKNYYKSLPPLSCRNSRSEVLCVKKVFLKVLQNLRENTYARVSFLKKRLWYRCFPVNFASFLIAPIFIEQIRWLLSKLTTHNWGNDNEGW